MLSCSRLAAPLAALLLLAAVPAGAQVARLRPADEAAQEPSFFSFRARLLEALARRDTVFLFAHTAPDVRVSFGVENGRDVLKQQWDLAGRPEESKLWPTLARVVGAGGRFYESGLFAAPYVYTDWPDSLDVFEHIAVVGERVRVRAAPSAESAVLAHLSFAVVPLAEWRDTDWESGWRKVRLANGRAGYVASDYLYSPVGYRAGFEKQGGGWMMTFFIAGD